MQAAARPKVMVGLALAGANLIVVTPIASPPVSHLTTAAVRLADSSTDLLGLGGLDSLANDLTSVPLGFQSFLDSGLNSLTSGLNLGGVTGELGSGLTSGLSGLLGASSGGGLENIPYNVIADLINMPYNESLALQEYASALGPADNALGVPGWIPPGTPASGIDMTSAGPVYALGGTGSYYAESLGNTWGWDDGNFPQLDGISSAVVPFPAFEQPFVDQIQSLFQSEAIDGAAHNCEFECASVIGYLGNWFHTPLTSLLSPGATFPETLQGDVMNPTTQLVTWAGQPGATLNPLAPFEGLLGNGVGGLTASPATNPIEIVNPDTFFTNALQLYTDLNTDFDPFITGSFLYWGAPTDYSVPSLIGGTIQDLTGIPNQFGFPTDQPLGAEPSWGPEAGPTSLLTGIPQGFQYLLFGPGGTANGLSGGAGLLGYLNPETYLTAITNLLQGNVPAVLDEIPLLGFLGLPEPGALLGDPTPLLGTFDPTAALGGTFDPAALLGSTFDPAALLGSTFDPSALLSTFDPSTLLGALDPGSLAGDFGGVATNLGGSLVPDLALNLLTSIF